MARLEDITGKAISGEWGLDDEDATGIPVLRTTNFTNDGVINFSNVVTRTITKKDLSSKYLRPGDIIIEKSGGSDKQPVGRVVYYEEEPNRYLFNNFTGVLRIMNPNLWNSKYVFYALYANYLKGGTRKYQNKTTGLHNLKTEQYVREFDLRECSIQEQRQIVFFLDKLSEVISLRKEQLSKLDELVKARFVEMFGDMLLNPMIWPEKPLESMAGIVSGITKGRKTKSTELFEVPYMAVSNVKDGYIDWTTVKTILATQSEIDQYRVLPNDVLMTEGGDPDKLGRGAIIREPLENCIHQNHIFRVRLDRNIALPEFFAEYLQHQKAKRYFLGCAKQTTGIASVNMKQLRALPVLLPPVGKQGIFADFAERVEQQKLTIQQSLDKLEVLKKSLMQEYFG